MKWPVYQMDVKLAFLNYYLDQQVYVEQPEGYEFPGQEHKVYRLKKVIYGMNQAPIAWYSHIDSYLIENGFHRSESELTLHTKVNEQGNMLIFFLYVYDLIFIGDFGIKEFRIVMEREFEMTDLGFMKFFLREFHKRTKHVDTRYHFIRELVNNKDICLEFCTSEISLQTYLQNHYKGIRSNICKVI